METKEKKVEFYGGAVGVWTPVIVMLIGMIINTVLAGGLTTLPMVTFLAMAVGFLLAKDKKTFGSVTLKGLQNPMFGTEAVAFIFAGILAQLLRQSGLIQALIYVVAQLELNTGLIPLIAFLTCMLISTACGTSTGSVTAVAPVLLPLAFSLDINPGLMCGAIISGAIFGDNLAPISDTTIGSALTQEADLGRVVRTRFPYAAVSAAVSAVLFVVIGLSSSSGVPSAIDLDGSTLPALVLLVLPVIMVVLMRLGWDLMSTLIICNLTGMVLNLVLGTIGFTVMFSASGPISAGMSGMMTLVLYVMLLFLVLEILNSSGAFEQVSRGIMRFCKTPRSAELVCLSDRFRRLHRYRWQRHCHHLLRLSGPNHHQGFRYRPLPGRQHPGWRGLRCHRPDAPRQSHPAAGLSGPGADPRHEGLRLPCGGEPHGPDAGTVRLPLQLPAHVPQGGRGGGREPAEAHRRCLRHRPEGPAGVPAPGGGREAEINNLTGGRMCLSVSVFW